MKYFTLALILMVFGNSSLMALQSDATSIAFKTIALYNEDFLVSNNWKDIPLNDSTGEDLNSKPYGGIYYPAAPRGKDLIEERTSIAQGFMEIEVNLSNKTQDSWLLSSIDLIVTSRYALSDIAYESGKWEAGSRTMDYNPQFQITKTDSIITEVDTGIILKPRDEFQDANMIIEVDAGFGADGKPVVLQFNFVYHFTNPGKENEKLQVTSDKTYFIASN